MTFRQKNDLLISDSDSVSENFGVNNDGNESSTRKAKKQERVFRLAVVTQNTIIRTMQNDTESLDFRRSAAHLTARAAVRLFPNVKNGFAGWNRLIAEFSSNNMEGIERNINSCYKRISAAF